jgi:hypothetical protein
VAASGRHGPELNGALNSALRGCSNFRMQIRHWLGFAWAAGLFGVVAPLAAQEDAAPLEEIVITGEFPGPGLWKVTRPGDAAGNTLWIVGDPWALPKRGRRARRAGNPARCRSEH